MKRILHWFIHRFGWNHVGKIETWTRADGRTMVGFRCCGCGKLTGIEAVRFVTRHPEGHTSYE